jgi:ATP-dependent helicase/nuclease subunit A
MTLEHKALHELTVEQLSAVEPQDNIWLGASAGTGKTQVLTARVIRLLLEENVNPENLLCITFTKAGAAEMAERINGLLASWVQLDDKAIFHDLEAIGAESGTAEREKASSLFAKILDAPGGGLQILTIHSLCQSLLGSFPEEAGLIPGFALVEDREQEELYRQILAEIILEAEQGERRWLVTNLQEMALSLGEEPALKFLKRCAAEPEAMAGVPEDVGAIIYARHLVDLSFEGSVENLIAESSSDTAIDLQSIRAIAAMNLQWGTKTGLERAENIQKWLSFSAAERGKNFELLHYCWSTKKGELGKVVPKDDAYAHIILELFQWSTKLLQKIKLAEYAERLAKALLVGKAFSARYASGKAERGLVDYDDMIRKTAAMLKTGGMSDWIRYKLDRQIDHILVDEAQDTNAAQWEIIEALSDDFFSGAAAKGDKPRTIFAVGDYKQAIFGFQGTDPQKYEEAGNQFAGEIAKAGSTLERLSLDTSFRSTQPVLAFVNAVIAQAGPERFGISRDIEDHVGRKKDIGMIELFAPVLPPIAVEAEEGSSGDDDESWLTKEKAILAHRISVYVRRLIDEKPILASTGKPLVPGDIMILLRTRSDLASSLVGRLHAVGVPVAGIDRLRLLEPIAVQDMLAAVRFVLQPSDDMSLACLLVSPIFGWSPEKMLQYGYRENGISLWRHIRDQLDLSTEVEELREILAKADFTTSYHFLENILSGPLNGRKKMAARLGDESLVPLEEMLNAALQFEQNHGGSLQAFLAWFEAGSGEIKREGVTGSDEVRVMTVHGSKGLQAPVVILADVTSDPAPSAGKSTELPLDDGSRLPFLTIKAADKIGQLELISDMQKERELAEHARLLYVAMTRAEERLVMAGALGSRAKGVPPEHSWYPALVAGMEALGCEWQDELPWRQVMRYQGGMQAKLEDDRLKPVAAVPTVLPSWILKMAPQESRPPRPLVPSQLGDDDFGDAPATAAMRAGAEKGRLLHALFERVSGGDIAASLAAAQIWLERNNREDAIDNGQVLAELRGVIEHSDYARFFGPDAYAEVPFAAVIGDTVVNGRVDRLVIEADMVRVVDFKTGRNIPRDGGAVPIAYLRQMAHYVAALEVIFEGKQVEASLLFTHGPKLVNLTPEDLAPHKPSH